MKHVFMKSAHKKTTRSPRSNHGPPLTAAPPPGSRDVKWAGYKWVAPSSETSKKRYPTYSTSLSRMSLSATVLCSSRIFSKTFSASSTPTASSARWSSPSVSTSPPPKSLSGEKTTSKSPPTLNLAALSRETSRS
ncbi:unnamed protein product [Brassica oleracea var. botrytis]